MILLVLFWISSASAFETEVITRDGAWCWFQDERAIMDGGKLLVGSISSQGDIQVSGSGVTTVLHSKLERDDHDAPALLKRSDGKVMAFYAKHGTDHLMRFRVKGNAGWEPEQSYSAGLGKGFAYANPFELGSRIVNFWRGAFWNPTVSSSDDGGKSWSKGRRFVVSEGRRPYVKYATNGRDRVDFAFTEAHPLEFFREARKTSIYHAYYKDGLIYRSNDRRIGAATTPEQATLVYDASPDGRGMAWIWDVEVNPLRMVFATVADVTAPARDHRYHYAVFEGARWNVQEIGRAGSALYADEPYYSGGISLDPDQAGVAYASANVDPATGAKLPHYELFKWAHGSWRALTTRSRDDQLRPIVPRGHPPGTYVLWMRGRYTSYVDYLTEVVLGRE